MYYIVLLLRTIYCKVLMFNTYTYGHRYRFASPNDFTLGLRFSLQLLIHLPCNFLFYTNWY